MGEVTGLASFGSVGEEGFDLSGVEVYAPFVAAVGGQEYSDDGGRAVGVDDFFDFSPAIGVACLDDDDCFAGSWGELADGLEFGVAGKDADG